MSFCPNCGKAVTEQASNCAACCKELEPRAKAARFKGTMMMQAGAAPPGMQPPAAEPPKPAPAPAAVAPQVAAPAVNKPTGPSPSKVMKATMLGTGGPGLAPPGMRGSAAQPAAPGAAGQKPVAAPPPAAGTSPASKTANDLAFAETSVHQSMTGPIEAVAKPQPQPQAQPAAPSAAREDSHRFLAGDPMAPSRTGAEPGRRSARDSLRAVLPVESTGKLIGIGVGGALAIVVIGYFAARLLGLLH